MDQPVYMQAFVHCILYYYFFYYYMKSTFSNKHPYTTFTLSSTHTTTLLLLLYYYYYFIIEKESMHLEEQNVTESIVEDGDKKVLLRVDVDGTRQQVFKWLYPVLLVIGLLNNSLRP